ncbi:hypothetical protein ACO2Q2_00435 [Dyella sp. KRB-257]|uniref:hypothetical protein n=1 Tax=Dyella sp. KRB-257 TaxID=3400915 RepID=UPI003C10C81C
MTLAAILAKHKPAVCPHSPERWGHAGDAQTVAPQRVPTVPTVPTPKRDPERTRAFLLAMAARLDVEAATVECMPLAELEATAQQAADVLAINGPAITRRFLESYLMAWRDTLDRQAGRVPAGHTAPMHCAHCGPVWAHPGMAAALPMVGGWPRALGCPWCFVRQAGGYIPRPRVTCEGCAHFTPDTINPEAGMGTCGAGNGSHYPMQRHVCAGFAITTEKRDLA